MTTSSRGLTWVCDTTCTGALTIDGVDMHRLAWCVDLEPLYDTPALFGADKALPDAEVVAYPREPTTTRHSLPFSANGHWDRLDVETPAGGNVMATLEANLAWLNTNALLQPASSDGTRAVVWTTAGGTVIAVRAHVLGLVNTSVRSGLLRASLELSVPNGDLHL